MPARRPPAPLEPGLSSFLFGWGVRHGAPPVDEETLVALAVRSRCRVVQLGDNLPVHAMTPARRDALAASIARHGLRLELGARGMTARHLARYVRLAHDLDVQLLRFVVDQGRYRPTPDAIVSIVRGVLPDLERRAVTLAIENHDRFPAAELRAIVDAVGHPRVGVCLDTANSFGAGEGLAEVTRVLAPVTVNLHVKDVTIRRVPSQMGFTVAGCPLGRGDLPIAETVAAVRRTGRCRSVILESWTPEAGTVAATVAREALWARQSLRALSRLLASG